MCLECAVGWWCRPHSHIHAVIIVLQSKLAVEWRQWMTENLLQQYMAERTFYQMHNTAAVDNPDQRISADIR